MVVVCQILLFNCNDVCLWIVLLDLKKKKKKNYVAIIPSS